MKTLPVVPAGAVLQGDGKTSVWVEKEPGRFQPVEVKVGERAGNMLLVLSGLKAGACVVTDGAMLLFHLFGGVARIERDHDRLSVRDIWP